MLGQALPATCQETNKNIQPASTELLSPTCGQAMLAVGVTEIGETLTKDMRCGLHKDRFPSVVGEDTQRKQKPGDQACTDSPKNRELHAPKPKDGDGQALLAVDRLTANDDTLKGLCARLKTRRAAKTHELVMLLLL